MISVSDAEAAIGPVEFSARTLGGDVYMGWRGEGLFVNAGTGFGLDEYDDFQRVTPVGGFVHRAGRADGWSAGARVQTGVWLQAGGFALSPRVGLNALRAKTSEFQEDGPSARQRIAERAVGGLNGELALRAETSLSQGVRIHGELGYREWLTSDSEDLRVSLVDNTANELSVGSDTTEGVTLVDLGISAPAFGRVRLGATYRGRMSDGRDSHAALFSASMRY
jgi:outer membrane lipase/esterase